MRVLLVLCAVVLPVAVAAQVTPPAPIPPEMQKTLERFDGGLSEADSAMETAKLFFAGLSRNKAEYLLASLAADGWIEGRHYTGELYHRAWVEALQRAAGASTLRVNGIMLLTAAEMEAKYGKAPARLHTPSEWTTKDIRFGVANLSGQAAVVVLKREGPLTWKVVGFTD